MTKIKLHPFVERLKIAHLEAEIRGWEDEWIQDLGHYPWEDDGISFSAIRDVENPDTYNDVFIVRGPHVGEHGFKLFRGSTDPGRHGLRTLPGGSLGSGFTQNRNGVAIMADTFFRDNWFKGEHPKNHTALINWKHTMVYRDRNADGQIDTDSVPVRNGTGIWFHSARSKGGGKVGLYSLGCQIVEHQREADEIVNLVLPPGRTQISYAIFDVRRFEILRPILDAGMGRLVDREKGPLK